MNENNKENPEGKQASYGAGKIKRDTLKRIIIGLAGLAVVILIFGAGIFIGEMKARFSYRWAENYHQNFAGPRGGFFGDVSGQGQDFIEAHGTFGQIIKIDPSASSGQAPSASSGQAPSASSGQATLIIKGRDNVEKIILLKQDTTIRSPRETVKPSDLKVGDYVVVIGEPNISGQIEAKFIRIMLAPPKLQ